MVDRNQGLTSQQGVVLLAVMLLVTMLFALAVLSLNLGILEIHINKAARDEAAARHLAESGVDVVMQWFHDPASAPKGPHSHLFVKRHELPEFGPSFLDADGRSQFTGTGQDPDLYLDASISEHERLLNDPAVGWFRAFQRLGRILELKVYGPSRPGLLSTVETTAGRAGTVRTIAMQLGALMLPPLHAAIQARNEMGATAAVPQSGTMVPVWAHWGDVKINGNAFLGLITELPEKRGSAPVTAASYAEMSRREDRWIDILVGGDAQVAGSTRDPAEVPDHVHSRQEPEPGLRIDQWEYGVLKEVAKDIGAYYVPGHDGWLYEDGTFEPEKARSVEDVFGSREVGDHRGLVFIDTLDRQAPHSRNLVSLSLQTPYAEGVYVVNAYLTWAPIGSGQRIPALSPPDEGSSSVGTRAPVLLDGINLEGVLYVAGDLQVSRRARVHGAVVAGGALIQTSRPEKGLEVWYNADLGSGLVRGLPLVYRVPGTWQDLH